LDVDIRTRDKCGAPLHLRRVHRSDLDAVVELEQAIVAADVGVVLEPEESTQAGTTRQFDTFEAAGHRNALFLGALSGTVLVGTAEVRRHKLKRMQHSGGLTLGVHPDWQGRGIGRALLRSALAWADGVGLSRVELNVLAHNHRAVQLYKSAGFVVEGTRKNAFLFPCGRWVDDHFLARLRQ